MDYKQLTPDKLDQILADYADTALKTVSVVRPATADPMLWAMAIDKHFYKSSVNVLHNSAVEQLINEYSNPIADVAKNYAVARLKDKVPDADVTEGANKLSKLLHYSLTKHHMHHNVLYDLTDDPEHALWYEMNVPKYDEFIEDVRDHPEVWSGYHIDRSHSVKVRPTIKDESVLQYITCNLGLSECAKRSIGLSPLAKYSISMGKT